MPWLWQSSKLNHSPNDEKKKDPIGTWHQSLNTQPTLVQTLLISSTSITAFIVLARVYKRYLRRIPGVNYLEPDAITEDGSRSLWGYVTRVGDGDNFHLFHAPGGRLLGWGWLPGRRIMLLSGKELKGKTVHVRIAGVDAPELSHFGRPAQPYGEEALEWLKGYVGGRWVRVQMYRRDQYERVVCTVTRRRWLFFKSDVGLAMIRQGLATVYEARTGSVFGDMEEKYRAAEALAKKRKIGMWQQPSLVGRLMGISGRVGISETPREFKTRYAHQGESNGPGKSRGVAEAATSAATMATKTAAAKAASAVSQAATGTKPKNGKPRN